MNLMTYALPTHDIVIRYNIPGRIKRRSRLFLDDSENGFHSAEPYT